MCGDGRLAGRTAIVFGGGHGGDGPGGVVGIGFACASTFGAHGANVVVVDRDAGPGGVPTRSRRAEELTLAEWRAAVAVNLDTVFLGAKATLGHLVKTRGSMVNVSSTGSIRWTGYPYSGYAASKAAVNQLTRSLAMQYADRGVRVNAILPGLIDTPLVYRELSEGHDASTVRADRAARSPTGAMGTAQDVANAALFLACDESAYVTGTLLPVDGGLHVRVI